MIIEKAWRKPFVLGLLLVTVVMAAAPSPGRAAQGAAPAKAFTSPEEAAEALVHAAERFDVDALKQILGPDGVELVVTEDTVLDRNQSAAFAAQARKQMHVTRDPAKPRTAMLSVGEDDWPMPIPIVERGGKWRFDTKSGREEVLYRRIGRNELDAIDVCRGYVAAQIEYASEKRDGAQVNQYAQRVISTPGKRDGLAWQEPDGTWGGPVGEGIARAIADGYHDRSEPYHGYYFRILKGQGPHAPLGELDFIIGGAMIGGFALVAAPADYRTTGVKTFIVSHDGVVFEKDLGPKTLERFRKMILFDPDESWEPVPES